MDDIKILLGKSRHMHSANEDNFIGVELGAYEKVLPPTEDMYSVDAYQQYFREKDASDKFRFAFTIVPFCSNVLFNVLTEPVYAEGSDSAFTLYYGENVNSQGNPFGDYNSRPLNTHTAIMDTGYSHPKTSKTGIPLVYHCGYDIFNNHFLRKKEFSVVNRVNNETSQDKEQFNTIGDFLRDHNGDVVTEKILQIKDDKVDTVDTNVHLYQYETIRSFSESVFDNLVENNGWFGFLNATTVPIDNFTGVTNERKYSLNKCMNNNKAWEQIDMYPDRSLYSFVPKLNKFRGRIEKNWDYCMTYPSDMTTDNPLVTNPQLNITGIQCKMITRLTEEHLENGNAVVTFKSFLRHNLQPGGYVMLSFVESGLNERKTATPAKVVSLGYQGRDSEHYFSVRLISILNQVVLSGVGKVTGFVQPEGFTDIRMRRFENGGEAQYYIRIFKKFPNAVYTNSLNKLAFAQNVYSDQVAQIVFTDDFNTSELKDNLGRPISEVYLTIVKRNQGYVDWYKNEKYSDYIDENDEKHVIEFSHCFGEVTSGFDMPEDGDCANYNVHRIHSIYEGMALNSGITPSPVPLEKNITIDGSETLGIGEKRFYGDIVEFMPSTMKETSIEPVYHRFNTAQREFAEENNNKYSSFCYDEILHDDYDIDENFKIDSKIFGEPGKKCCDDPEWRADEDTPLRRINLVPEGYYYKPHYKVLIRDFEEEVNQGSHIAVPFVKDREHVRKIDNNTWWISTSKNCYFETSKYIYIDSEGGVHTDDDKCEEGAHEGMEKRLIRKPSKVYAYKGSEVITGYCKKVEGKDFRDVTIEFESAITITDGWKLFRHNTEMPDTAYQLPDGTGRYLWRNVLSYADMVPSSELYDETFTNGAHYFHRNIMFYLKRQDPDGRYGIGLEPADTASFFSITGKEKDVSVAEYVKEGEGTVC